MEQLRNSDAFGRFGGEEFVAVLTETAYADGLQLAERIRQLVKQERFPKLDDLQCTVSIGVADFLPGEQILDPVLERADQALYQAKAAGRDRVQGANGELDKPASRAAASRILLIILGHICRH